MDEEGKSHDNDTELIEIFTVPEFKEKATCITKEHKMKNIIYFILGFIFTFSGYSSFVNLLATDGEAKKVEVKITKSVFNSKFSNDIDIIQDKDINSNIDKNGNSNKKEYMLEPLV